MVSRETIFITASNSKVNGTGRQDTQSPVCMLKINYPNHSKRIILVIRINGYVTFIVMINEKIWLNHKKAIKRINKRAETNVENCSNQKQTLS